MNTPGRRQGCPKKAPIAPGRLRAATTSCHHEKSFIKTCAQNDALPRVSAARTARVVRGTLGAKDRRIEGMLKSVTIPKNNNPNKTERHNENHGGHD